MEQKLTIAGATQSALFFSLLVCAFFQTIYPPVANGFQIVSFALFLAYLVQEPAIVKSNLVKCKFFILFFIIFLLCQLPALFAASSFRLGWKIYVSLYLLRPLLFLVAAAGLKNKKQAEFVLFTLIASFIVSCIFSLFNGPIESYGGRYVGFYGHPMILAGFGCVAIPALIVYLFNTKNLFWGICSLSALTLCLCTLFLNATRGAWIALMAAFAIVFCFSAKNLKRNFAFLVLFASVISIVALQSPHVENRLSSMKDVGYSSNLERVRLWKSSVNMFLDHPYTGVGLDNYAKAYQQKYRSPHSKEPNLTRAHSNVFQLLGENGPIGLFGYLALMTFLLFHFGRLVIKNKNLYALIGFTSTLAIFLQGLTEFNLGHSNLMKYFWIWLGTLWLLAIIQEESKNSISTSYT